MGLEKSIYVTVGALRENGILKAHMGVMEFFFVLSNSFLFLYPISYGERFYGNGIIVQSLGFF